MRLETTLAAQLLSAHPDEAASVLEGMRPEAAVIVLAGSSAEAAATLLSRLAPHRAAAALGHLDAPFRSEVVGHLGFDDAADLIRRMDPEARDRLVDALDPEQALPINRLLNFPDGAAGSLMDSRVLALPLDVTAREAVAEIRRTPENVRYNLYVVDREHRLVGVLNLRELLVADPEDVLGDIARREVMSIGGHEDRAAVLTHKAWREAPALPVVDRHGTYLGAIRYRTWRMLAEEEVRERAALDPTAADALGELFSTGLAGVIGALTHIVASPTAEASDDPY